MIDKFWQMFLWYCSCIKFVLNFSDFQHLVNQRKKVDHDMVLVLPEMVEEVEDSVGQEA
jgi:hypothetical protein